MSSECVCVSSTQHLAGGNCGKTQRDTIVTVSSHMCKPVLAIFKIHIFIIREEKTCYTCH